MTDSQNWRTEVNAGDYFLHQKKQAEIEARRPVVRTSSDLVGPGIGASTVRITDYNDLLATFNGYYSSAPGALNAPNATDAFTGYVVSDAEFGGQQVFTSTTSGIEYTRAFNRSPTDPETLGWTNWSGQRIPPTARGHAEVDTSVTTGSATMLTAPSLTLIGDTSVYDRSPAGIRITKQGVYTGYIQVGDRVGSTTTGLFIYIPNGLTTIVSGHSNTVPLAPTKYIPFTAVCLDGLQGISVMAQHTMGDTRVMWWRFGCTRIGDAY